MALDKYSVGDLLVVTSYLFYSICNPAIIELAKNIQIQILMNSLRKFLMCVVSCHYINISDCSLISYQFLYAHLNKVRLGVATNIGVAILFDTAHIISCHHAHRVGDSSMSWLYRKINTSITDVQYTAQQGP